MVIPLSDEHITVRVPVMTYLIIAANILVWFYFEGAGFDGAKLAASVCNYGMVPGELTRLAPLGSGIPLGNGMACIIDNEPVNIITPVLSMFLHGSWMHLLLNMLFLWVFGNNIEDSMGSGRFLAFYLLCGLGAAAAHVFVAASSPVPTVGASGAISGIMGAYLVLYPRTRVRTFIVPFFVVRIQAWVVLIFWFVSQVLSGLPELSTMRPEVSSGVAFWAHVGGFVAGLLLVKIFENPALVVRRSISG